MELFARFEGALKGSGMLQEKNRAEASWVTLAGQLAEEFFADVRDSGQAVTLIGEPPRTQMRRDMVFEPENPAAIGNVRELFLRGVCQVRNNLAHGAKFLGPDGERERSKTLISEAAWVLGEVAKRRPDLKL